MARLAIILRFMFEYRRLSVLLIAHLKYDSTHALRVFMPHNYSSVLWNLTLIANSKSTPVLAMHNDRYREIMHNFAGVTLVSL
jgi:hypothetical protein